MSGLHLTCEDLFFWVTKDGCARMNCQEVKFLVSVKSGRVTLVLWSQNSSQEVCIGYGYAFLNAIASTLRSMSACVHVFLREIWSPCQSHVGNDNIWMDIMFGIGNYKKISEEGFAYVYVPPWWIGTDNNWPPVTQVIREEMNIPFVIDAEKNICPAPRHLIFQVNIPSSLPCWSIWHELLARLCRKILGLGHMIGCISNSHVLKKWSNCAYALSSNYSKLANLVGSFTSLYYPNNATDNKCNAANFQSSHLWS